MTQLSEIETAYREGNYTKGDSLSSQWYCERGITVHHGDTPQSVMMRYIEQLEAERNELKYRLQAWIDIEAEQKAQHEREEAR